MILRLLKTSLLVFLALAATGIAGTRLLEHRYIDSEVKLICSGFAHTTANILPEHLRNLPLATDQKFVAACEHPLSVSAADEKYVLTLPDNEGKERILGYFSGAWLPDNLTTLLWILLSAAVSVGVGAAMTGSLMLRVRAMEKACRALVQGDLTSRMPETSNDALSHLAMHMNHVAERLVVSIRLKDLLLKGLAHDLRTPLSRASFALALAEEAPEGSKQPHLLRLQAALEATNARLDGLVSGLDGDVAAMSLGPVDLPALIEGVVVTIADRRISLIASPQTVQGDPRLLVSLVQNLIDNALAHAETQVVVTVTSSQEGVRLWVDDDGPGIPLVDRAQARQPFQRLQVSGPGLGLGLSLVDEITRLHRGTLTIMDGPMGGARLEVLLPHQDILRPPMGL